MADDVVIPGKAVDDGQQDLKPPVRRQLEDLLLLPKSGESGDGFITALTGPPQSVALIEAGATAATKWWSAGLSAVATVASGLLVGFWNSEASVEVKMALIIGLAVLLAAVVVAIGMLLSADVRGRAAATVATVNARAQVAAAMTQAAEAVFVHPNNGSLAPATENGEPAHIVPLAGFSARYNQVEDRDADDWMVLGMRPDADGKVKEYVIAKGNRPHTVPYDQVELRHG